MRAIDRAEVVLLVIDSTIGLTDQDQRVAGMAAERGCAMVVVLNKWDLVEGPDAKAEVRERIEDRLKFVGYAPVIAISALPAKTFSASGAPSTKRIPITPRASLQAASTTGFRIFASSVTPFPRASVF